MVLLTLLEDRVQDIEGALVILLLEEHGWLWGRFGGFFLLEFLNRLAYWLGVGAALIGVEGVPAVVASLLDGFAADELLDQLAHIVDAPLLNVEVPGRRLTVLVEILVLVGGDMLPEEGLLGLQLSISIHLYKLSANARPKLSPYPQPNTQCHPSQPPPEQGSL